MVSYYILGIYFLIGIFAGFMGGLFGIGGGVVIIPALASMFARNSIIPTDNIMQMAVGTSLATIIITSLSSMYAHHKRKAVIWPVVKKTTPWLIVGAIIGASVVHFLPSKYLRIFFSIFLIATSIRLIVPMEHEAGKKISETFFRIGALIIGILASILGVAGGTLLVPFLLYCQLDMREATGTSVACGLSVGIVATICFMISGLLANIQIPYSTGYIYWPAFAGIAVASAFSAPIGARLANTLPRELLKHVFAVLLILMAVDMVLFRR